MRLCHSLCWSLSTKCIRVKLKYRYKKSLVYSCRLYPFQFHSSYFLSSSDLYAFVYVMHFLLSGRSEQYMSCASFMLIFYLQVHSADCTPLWHLSGGSTPGLHCCLSFRCLSSHTVRRSHSLRIIRRHLQDICCIDICLCQHWAIYITGTRLCQG